MTEMLTTAGTAFATTVAASHMLGGAAASVLEEAIPAAAIETNMIARAKAMTSRVGAGRISMKSDIPMPLRQCFARERRTMVTTRDRYFEGPLARSDRT